METSVPHLVVMGVAGVGKSTIAQALAARMDLELAEGDDFHPQANIDKMSAGTPLTDDDRWPWLERLAGWTAERDEQARATVVTCSALKRGYRDVLRTGAADTFFVHLHGDEELIRSRMEGRDHFMPASLLHSQFETLEPLESDERGVAVDVALDVDTIIAETLRAL